MKLQHALIGNSIGKSLDCLFDIHGREHVVIIIINLIHNLEFDLSKTCIENHTFFYFFSAKCYSIYSMMI